MKKISPSGIVGVVCDTSRWERLESPIGPAVPGGETSWVVSPVSSRRLFVTEGMAMQIRRNAGSGCENACISGSCMRLVRDRMVCTVFGFLARGSELEERH